MIDHSILMADDDADDRFLVQAAFEDNNIPYNVLFFEDGEQLLTHLKNKMNEVAPSFILLDLNMPKRDGRDVLKVLKADSRLRSIPIIIFSTSKAPDDVDSSYRLGANSYVVKPTSYEHLKDVILKISDFWLNTALTPS
ncbi:response regulator [Rhabdobacter roseus]|uniref:Two-component system response regulator n=1 Tax=Rhabdobacter roseus TaxID=1655419 RepID=A0A840TI58_9BACT|nr:response regulator [Rhabdobacter roseus]MBB5283846.1 two-component system response regulator [Rhabdobacter roseus]